MVREAAVSQNPVEFAHGLLACTTVCLFTMRHRGCGPLQLMNRPHYSPVCREMGSGVLLDSNEARFALQKCKLV